MRGGATSNVGAVADTPSLCVAIVTNGPIARLNRSVMALHDAGRQSRVPFSVVISGDESSSQSADEPATTWAAAEQSWSYAERLQAICATVDAEYVWPIGVDDRAASDGLRRLFMALQARPSLVATGPDDQPRAARSTAGQGLIADGETVIARAGFGRLSETRGAIAFRRDAYLQVRLDDYLAASPQHAHVAALIEACGASEGAWMATSLLHATATVENDGRLNSDVWGALRSLAMLDRKGSLPLATQRRRGSKLPSLWRRAAIEAAATLHRHLETNGARLAEGASDSLRQAMGAAAMDRETGEGFARLSFILDQVEAAMGRVGVWTTASGRTLNRLSSLLDSTTRLSMRQSVRGWASAQASETHARLLDPPRSQHREERRAVWIEDDQSEVCDVALEDADDAVSCFEQSAAARSPVT